MQIVPFLRAVAQKEDRRRFRLLLQHLLRRGKRPWLSLQMMTFIRWAPPLLLLHIDGKSGILPAFPIF